jgi:hypothetical protein
VPLGSEAVLDPCPAMHAPVGLGQLAVDLHASPLLGSELPGHTVELT